jgi:tetraacyldisaccharide 4'-kinase
MGAKGQSTILQAWTGKGPLARLLWPVSQFYRALVALRRQLFLKGILRSQRAHAFVIVVGNVVAGGAGKTPTVIALAQHLRSQGFRVGVISKGYGRQSRDYREVSPGANPQDVGDEPILLQHATQAPVFVGPDRHRTALALLAQYPETNVLVCDDGLQDYRLWRDLEICVFDDRACGNGWLLPAGPLREPWPRQPVACAGQSDQTLLVLNTSGAPQTGQFSAQRTLASHAHNRQGQSIALEQFQDPGRLPLKAVAGIARPELFFDMLRQTGLRLSATLPLADHDSYSQQTERSLGNFELICTEKDAPKLWPIAPHAWSVALVQTLEPAFLETIEQQIKNYDGARLSSQHGH